MYKLLIVFFIICLFIKFELLGKILNVILPFILSLILVYLIYPLYKKLQRLPKYISITIIIIILSFVFISIYLVIPLLKEQFINLINYITNYLNIISIKYNLDLTNIYKKLDYKTIINNISSSVTTIIIFILSFIYIMIDIDKIEYIFKKYKERKICLLLNEININLKQYINSLLKISIISFFEYYIAFYLIKYPNPLLIGLIASITNLIPYIGGIFVLIIALISSPNLIIKISILYFILSLIDTYIINPYIYNKYNHIHPLLELLFITVLSYIFGYLGLIFSIPLTIIIITSIKFYKQEIINYFKTKYNLL